jgi:SPP1 family predicted phage head-tail adaptor
VNSGRLKKYITLKRKFTDYKKQFSNNADVYTTYAQVWASITATDGNTGFTQESQNSENNYTVVIRYIPTVQARDRIYFNDRILRIENIINTDMMNRELTLFCVEQIDQEATR